MSSSILPPGIPLNPVLDANEAIPHPPPTVLLSRCSIPFHPPGQHSEILGQRVAAATPVMADQSLGLVDTSPEVPGGHQNDEYLSWRWPVAGLAHGQFLEERKRHRRVIEHRR